MKVEAREQQHGATAASPWRHRHPEASVAGPDPGALLRWLQSDDVVLPDGSVLSWCNPAHPGYRYPEAGALLLSLLAQRVDSPKDLEARIASSLRAAISPMGGVGRDGEDYLFDTAMVLSALLAHERGAGSAEVSQLYEFIARAIPSRQATMGGPGASNARWSRSFGAHLLKVALAIAAYGDHHGDPRCASLTEQLLDDLLPLFDGSRFRIRHGSSETYLHAHCYALEGLLGLELRRPRGFADILRRGAQWLADLQRPGGGLPAWYGTAGAHGASHADVAAQAIRIWAAVDRDGFAEPIEAALGFLSRLQCAAGGLRYRPGSDDVNTWASVFAVQASDWSREPPSASSCLI